MTRLSHREEREERGTGLGSQEGEGFKVGGEGAVTRMLPLGHFQVKGRDMPSHR